MDTSLNKTPKKRKSLANQNNTPAKVGKGGDGSPQVKTPKQAKTPKKNKTPQVNNSPKLTETQSKTPKKKQNSELENGGSPKKLEKFKGTKSLPKTKAINKDKPFTKRVYLIQKLSARSDKEGKEVVIKSLNERVDEILSRSEITKTAKRKLKNYQRLIKTLSGGESITSAKTSPKLNAKPAKANKVKQPQLSNKSAPKAQDGKQKPNSKNKKKVEVEDEDLEEESSDSEYVVEENIKNVKKLIKDAQAQNEASDDDESEDEENGDEENGEEEESDVEGEESDDEEDGDESVDEEEEESDEKPKKVIHKKDDAQPKKGVDLNQSNSGDKKSRYVLFIGNIAYDTTRQELQEHFERVGQVVDVRIPTERETSRPRGFAYVELADEAAYQKALDLNGSQLKNRKIKVEYTQGGNKNSDNKKKDIKAKNFKLHAMRKQGQFGGGNKGPNKGGFKGKGNFKKSF